MAESVLLSLNSQVSQLSPRAFSDLFLQKWTQVSEVLHEENFIHPVVRTELESRFSPELLQQEKWVRYGTQLSSQAFTASLDRNLIRLLESAVFLRYKVGLEALEIGEFLDKFPMDAKSQVYTLAKKIIAALLVTGSEGRSSIEDFIKAVSLIQFAREFIERLWDRFYDSNGVKRYKNQKRTLGAAFMIPEDPSVRPRGMLLDGRFAWGTSMPTDFKRFLRLAHGHWGLISRFAFESDIHTQSKRLPGTETIVLTRNPNYQANDCFVVHTIEEALDLAKADPGFCFFGHSIVYQLAMQKRLVDRIELAQVFANLPANVFFPEVNENDYRLVEDSGVLCDNESSFPFQFLAYELIEKSIK